MATDWELRNLTNIIYKITNKVNGMSYIGQTYYIFNERYKGGGKWWKYGSRLLKNAAKEYGIENFIIEILEHDIKSEHELNFLERFYISIFNSFGSNGYNLRIGGRNHKYSKESFESRSKSHSKTHFFVDLNGKEYEIKNLRIFCKENDLPLNIMRSIACGKITSSQGFALKGTDLSSIRDPNDIFKIKNLITNEVVEIKNLVQFCKNNNFSRTAFCKLKEGKTLRHGVWTLAETDLTKTQIKSKIGVIYKLKNINTNNIISGTSTELKKLAGLSKNGIYLVTKKKYPKPLKGWVLIEEI